MALYSLSQLAVLCALFQAAAAAIPCTGTRRADEPTTSPLGLYSNTKPIPVGGSMKVNRVTLNFEAATTPKTFNADVTYTQHLEGCLFSKQAEEHGCCQLSPTDNRVAPWEYLNGVPIPLESRSIGCNRNTWKPHKFYNSATKMCDERRECVVPMPLPPDKTYTTGHFHDSTDTGSKFLPIHYPKNDFERFIDDTLRIQWCPNEKYFVVMIEGVPYQLKAA